MAFAEVKYRGKHVGKIYGSRYVTPRDSTRHYFRKFSGYGASEELLKALQFNGVEIIEFKIDGAVRYQTTIERMLTEGDVWCDGGDFQRVLGITEMARLPGFWVEPRKQTLPEGLLSSPDDGLSLEKIGAPFQKLLT